MLNVHASRLDYLELVKEARRLVPGVGTRLRLALLADVSTQHLVPLLRALFARHGVEAEIYEAGYDTVELEAFDAGSRLYAFEPEVVVILQSLGKLKERYYGYQSDRGTFVEAHGSRTEDVWKAIRARSGAPIVQSTFVLPYERPFGNYGAVLGETLHVAVSELNRDLCQRARRNAGVLINDVDYLAGWVGRCHFIDEKLWGLAKSLCALEILPQVAQNIVDIALATRGRSVKCVVLDLDNTLWGGIVGEDGLDGIELGDLDEGGAFRALQQHLRELSNRGILLAVCSKNDDALARRVFREHPGMVLREQDIAVFVANWEDKATNIRRIRDKLNIGLDAMVFLDDNPFERNLVRQILPEVIVPELPEDPALYLRALSELNLFEAASRSALDEQRGALYRDQDKREEERTRFSNVGEYLRSLETTARVCRFAPEDLPRIAQLVQRSNQFNLTTRRYSDAECEALMRAEREFFPFSLTVKDRVGDFGLVAVVVLRNAAPALHVDAFLMSCRVLQRGVEQLAMNKVFEYARRVGHERVVGRFIPTAKNAMVRDFYERFGFHSTAEADSSTTWTLDVQDYAPREVFISEVG
jgi:FkbH-like protein